MQDIFYILYSISHQFNCRMMNKLVTASKLIQQACFVTVNTGFVFSPNYNSEVILKILN